MFFVGIASLLFLVLTSSCDALSVESANNPVLIRRPPNEINPSILSKFNPSNMNVRFNFDGSSDPEVLAVCTVDTSTTPNCPENVNPKEFGFPQGICTSGVHTITKPEITERNGTVGLPLLAAGTFKLCVYGGVKNNSEFSFPEKDRLVESQTFQASFSDDSSLSSNIEDDAKSNGSAPRHHAIRVGIMGALVVGVVGLL